jgi:Flp pilus assembly protein TadD
VRAPCRRGAGAVFTFAAALCMLAACTPADRGDPAVSAGRAAAGNPAGTLSAGVAINIAEQERATGDYPEAILFYRRALALEPDNQKALTELGVTLLDAGSPNEASEVFQKILIKAPRDPKAQIGLGEALLALDQPIPAAERLRQGLASGGDPKGFRALGVAEDLLGRFPEADEDYRKGLALAPDDPALRSDLGLSQALAGDFADSIANLRAAAAAPGATAQYRLNLALGLGLAGRMSEAQKVARLDLDERSVESNLAYYAQLRSLPTKERAEALLRPPAPQPQAAQAPSAQPASAP